MIDQKLIDRINELAKLSKERKLTAEEKSVKQSYKMLLDGLKNLSFIGKKDRFWWNGKEIRYIPLTDGKVDIKYVVASPISGNTTIIRPRDHMYKNGSIKFSSIARIISGI